MCILHQHKTTKEKSRTAFVEHQSGFLKFEYVKYQEKNFGHAKRHGIFYCLTINSLTLSLTAMGRRPPQCWVRVSAPKRG
jgi:hypothetical protein